MKTQTISRPVVFLLFAVSLGVASGNVLREVAGLESPESVGSALAAHKINRRGATGSVSFLGSTVGSVDIAGISGILDVHVLDNSTVLGATIVGQTITVNFETPFGSQFTLSKVLTKAQKATLEKKLAEKNIEIEHNEKDN